MWLMARIINIVQSEVYTSSHENIFASSAASIFRSIVLGGGEHLAMPVITLGMKCFFKLLSAVKILGSQCLLLNSNDLKCRTAR